MAQIFDDANEPYSEETHTIVKLYSTVEPEDPLWVKRLFEAAEEIEYLDHGTGKVPFRRFSRKKLVKLLHPIIVIDNSYGKPIRLAIPHEMTSMFWLRWG